MKLYPQRRKTWEWNEDHLCKQDLPSPWDQAGRTPGCRELIWDSHHPEPLAWAPQKAPVGLRLAGVPCPFSLLLRGPGAIALSRNMLLGFGRGKPS